MDFSKLNVDIFKGTAGKKVLFQPRICCWYDDKAFLKEPLPAPYTNLSLSGLYKKLNVSNRVYDYYTCFEKKYDKSIEKYYYKIDSLTSKIGYKTPIGEISGIIKANTSNPGSYYEKWLVETKEDIKVMTYVTEGMHYEFNKTRYNEIFSEWGELGAPTMFMLRTNIQECFVETMGVENTVYALMDEEESMHRYFKALNESEESLIDCLNNSDIKIINYGDNLHCAITPPNLFEKYVLPVYLHRRERFSGKGKFVHSHWDGNVKSLLKYAKICGLDGIEALTPFPQGDVSIAEIKEALGDEIVLLDGIAAVLFNKTSPEEELIKQTEELIKLFAGKLILGISDEMPSRGLIERVELVRDIVFKHNSMV